MSRAVSKAAEEPPLAGTVGSLAGPVDTAVEPDHWGPAMLRSSGPAYSLPGRTFAARSSERRPGVEPAQDTLVHLARVQRRTALLHSLLHPNLPEQPGQASRLRASIHWMLLLA